MPTIYPWITYTLGADGSFKVSPLSRTPSPAEQLAADARKLASEGKDLSQVTSAIEAELHVKQRGVEKSLEATLELYKQSSAGKSRVTKEFILVYQANNGETKTVRGIEWPDERDDKTEDYYEVRVQLGIHNPLPFGRGHYSIAKLKEALDTRNIIYRIAYID